MGFPKNIFHPLVGWFFSCLDDSMIDAHAHVHDPQFDTDRETVFLRAWKMGVLRIITVGTSVSESADALAMAKKHEDVFVTVAVHSHEYSKCSDIEMTQMWLKIFWMR